MDDLYALLLIGDEPRHWDEIKKFEYFLVRDLRLPQTKVRSLYLPPIVDGDVIEYRGPELEDEVETFLKNMKVESPEGTLLLVYQGHGNEKGFQPSGENIQYEKVAEWLHQVPQYIFLNDTCHSGGAIPVLGERGLLGTGMVMASSRTDQVSRGAKLLKEAVDCYKQRKPFTRQGLGSECTGTIFIEPNYKTGDYTKTFIPEEDLDKRFTQHTRKEGLALDHLLFPPEEKNTSRREIHSFPIY